MSGLKLNHISKAGRRSFQYNVVNFLSNIKKKYHIIASEDDELAVFVRSKYKY